MKNIHILKTDKPSRLWMTKLGNLTRCHDIKPIKEALGNNVNIYITNDEEIKEGDYYIAECGSIDRLVHKHIGKEPKGDYFKIILTTDQDLIKDGVQAIDNEFLEWFVKNPNCEVVSIDKNWNYPLDKSWEYKIIIPKEEPKQIKCYCGHTTICDCSPIDEPKQETLEKAAHKMLMDFGIMSVGQSINVLNVKKLMVLFAKWQQERMYSEEDMRKAFIAGGNSQIEEDDDYGTEYDAYMEDWFEQFKKK